MVDVVGNTNQQLVGALTSFDFMNALGWLVFGAVVIGLCIWGFIYWDNKRKFNKNITAMEIVNGFWQPVIRDKAKVVRIGTGGFEILFLQKLKTWKIAYGGRVGKDTYYFFIMPDGYWYNGMFNANLGYMDKNGGLTQVTTTNPLMRGQYTSLEKQIDKLHGDKVNFWDKYGSWVLGVAFVLIAGVMLWLNYKEFAQAMSSLSGYNENMNTLLDKVNTLITNVDSINRGKTSGLVPA